MSTTERRSEPLPEQADALLEGWPAPSRSALEWEDLANATVARIRETSVGSTNDDLLAPPLPKEDGEGDLVSEELPVSDAPADEPGLLAIAKAAVAEGAAQDSKDIARAGLMAAEHSRQSRPPAPPGRVDRSNRKAAGASAAGLQGHLPRASASPVEAVHEAQARSELPARPKSGNEGLGTGRILAGAMLALAAGVALYVAVHKTEPTALVAATSQEAQPAPTVRPEQPAGGVATAEPEQDENAKTTKTLALDELKAPDEPSAAESGKVVVPSATAPMSLALRKGVAANQAPSKKAEPSGAPNAAPEAAQEEAVARKDTGEPAAAPAQEQAGGASDERGLPSRPAVGAIQGAVGSVMLGARSCLAGQETGSKATVTFGPDGRVKSVSISGPAAGTPAEGCVRSALMGARVPPFSEPEYSASFTVRPP